MTALGAGLVFIAGILTLAISAAALHRSIITERKAQVKNLTASAIGVLDHYYDKESNGILTLEQAQNEAKQVLRAMRFGKSLEDYFWINDFKHNVIMHPMRPDFEGSNLYDYADSEGVFMFRDFVSSAHSDGGGFVPYRWQYYNDESRFEKKMSYVASFSPWGWIVGTGIYLNDLQKSINILIAQLLLVFFTVIFLTALIFVRFSWLYTAPIERGVNALRKLAENGDLLVEVSASDLMRQDEAGHLAKVIKMVIKSQRTMRESGQRYRDLIQNARAIILERDTKGVITFFNEYAVKSFGFTAAEVIGKNIVGTIVPEKDSSGRDLAKMINNISMDPDSFTDNENENITREGNFVWVRWSNRAVRDNNGKITGILSIGSDMTEKKKSEDEREKLYAQLMQMQKMESVGRLAGGVAHDFNNTLSVIIGNAELAAGQVDSSNPVAGNISEILSAAHRSASLTRQLLAFARKQTISPVVIDLNRTISSMVNMLKQLIGENIELVLKLEDSLWPVRMDPSQVDQIMANLTVNSRDAIVSAGTLTIETDNVVFDEAFCSLHKGFIPGEYAMLAVSDSGSGMDQETLKHIFEPFFTTKAVGKGTGLGVSMVYGIVKQNNGFINVYSEPGRGSCFKVYIPRAHEIIKADEKKEINSLTGGTETILIVEDELSILNLAETLLKRCGYNVLAANSPAGALEIVENYEGVIDLLITDVVMPAMNGKELKETVSAYIPDIKALYMSGYTADTIADHGILERDIHFIQKPFSLSTLTAKVREVLDS